jgi:hypothetical protein
VEIPRGWLRCAQCGQTIQEVECQTITQTAENSNLGLDAQYHSGKSILLLVAVFFICSAVIYGIVKYDQAAYISKNKIDVVFGIDSTQKDGQLQVMGTTNLPDGTDLVLVLSNESYSSESKVKVTDGSFSKQFSMDNKRLEVGLYNLHISVSAAMQDEAIQKRLGKNGEMLSGAFVAKKPGNAVNYAKTLQVD